VPVPKNPGVASVLSLVLPGVGQFYNGDFWRGLFWLIVTPGLWIGSGGLLGWVCHVLAAITAYRRAERKNRGMSVILGIIALLVMPAAAQSADSSWLDRSLVNWNKPNASLPRPETQGEPRDAILSRCRLTLRASTSGERALADGGWIPFLNVDRELVREDVEVVGGMTSADGMCRPMGFNIFVFVRGRFAGTLSPSAMSARLDGAAGAVRIVAADTISAEFARYGDADPLCCPSSRMTVRYRIDRQNAQATIVPLEVRTTRGI
jgi:TM2 domain-containing membrane protein YozV